MQFYGGKFSIHDLSIRIPLDWLEEIQITCSGVQTDSWCGGVLLTANQVKRTPFSEGLRKVENSRRESFWILCSLAAELNVSGFISMMLCSVWTLFTFLWLKEVLSAMQPCLVNIKKASVQPCCGHKFQTTPSTMKNLFLFPPAWNQTPLKCHRTRSVIMLNTGSVKWCCEAFVSCSV